jgi:hypothetical protein
MRRFLTTQRFMPLLRRVALLLAVLLWGNAFIPAQAQTGGSFIFVHTIETRPSNFPNSAVPGLKLTATFSLLEADGSVIRTRIKEGEARLLLGDLQTGRFRRPAAGWSVLWTPAARSATSIQRLRRRAAA